jgi:hypothetical protein
MAMFNFKSFFQFVQIIGYLPFLFIYGFGLIVYTFFEKIYFSISLWLTILLAQDNNESDGAQWYIQNKKSRR